MNNKTIIKRLRCLVLLAAAMLLSGCQYTLFDSKGVVGKDIGDTILLTAGIMLIVVIPTIILSVWLPFKFRASNTDAEYEPEWEHSNKIEAVVWFIPIAIIAVLATITYIKTHELDPREPLASDKEPLTIQVVALDWKWLFIYPEQKIATINEVAFPVNQPVEFLITSYTTMNSFFIPRLGGQLYAMGGMENRMNLMAKEEGVYRGLSSNYSGFGFSGMRFKAHVTNDDEFENWVNSVKASSKVLDEATLEQLKKKTRDHQPEYFSDIDPLQFKNIIEEFTGVQNGR